MSRSRSYRLSLAQQQTMASNVSLGPTAKARPSKMSSKKKTRKAKSSRSLPRAADNARAYPAPSHNRPNPYAPTLQTGGAYSKERGNPPDGVSDDGWSKAYNSANSHVYHLMASSTRIADAKRARTDGLTRDLAVEDLIAKGILSKGFVDASP